MSGCTAEEEGLQAGGSSKLIAQVRRRLFWVAASQTTVRFCSNKVRCGSSLARCCRFAVAPTFFTMSEVAGAFSNYGVAGLNFEGVVQAYAMGLYNLE